MIGLALGALAVGALVLVAAAWRDLLDVRNRLESAKATLDQVVAHPAVLDTATGREATTQQLRTALEEVTAAHDILARSFALKVAGYLPVASAQRQGALRLVDDTSVALTTGDDLVSEADHLVAQGKVQRAQVPIASLAVFQRDLQRAGATVGRLNRPASGLLGPLRKARQQFDTLATSTGTRLLDDADAVQVGEDLLGAGGVRHYFLALENNAEMRDQGTVLSYAILAVDDGHMQVTEHGPILTPLQVAGGAAPTLELASPAPVAIPAGTAQVFGRLTPTETWQSVNASADFDFTGQAIQAMFHQATRQSVDGVIALDVPAVASILNVVGPVAIPEVNEVVTATNAATVLLHDLYETFPDSQQQVARKEVLSEVVSDVVDRLSTGSFDPLPLGQSLGLAASGGHLRIWSDVGHEEATLERVGLGGGPEALDANRTFHVAVEDRDATKVDYYVRTAIRQQVTITATGTAIVRTTIMVVNGAPVGAAASYALGPDHVSTTQPGEYWAWVLLWGPAGSMQSSAVPESGLELSQTVLHTFAGQSAQTEFDTVLPNAVHGGKLSLRYVPQPRLFAPTLSVTVSAPGWSITGAPTWAGNWDRTLNLSWSLHP